MKEFMLSATGKVVLDDNGELTVQSGLSLVFEPVAVPVPPPPPPPPPPSPISGDHMFAGIKPASALWVRAGASGGNGGTLDPFPTISQAVAVAKPGMVIWVRGGNYPELVRFPSRTGGTPTAPIWLISADGKWQAHVVGLVGQIGAIRGLGAQNIVLDGFDVSGNSDCGVDFSMSGSAGSDYSLWDVPLAMPRGIVIRHMRVRHAATGSTHRDDSIRLSGVSNVEILDCVLVAPYGADAEDAIDCLAGDDVRIARNDISGSGEAGAISIKGGSRRVTIEYNRIHDAIFTRGTALGGWSNPGNLNRKGTSFHASGVVFRRNLFDRLTGAQYAVMIFGAVDSTIEENNFAAAGITGASVLYCTIGKTWAGANVAAYNSWPARLAIRNNVYSGHTVFFNYFRGGGDPGFAPIGHPPINLVTDQIILTNNVKDGVWSHPTGPAPYVPSVRP